VGEDKNGGDGVETKKAGTRVFFISEGERGVKGPFPRKINNGLGRSKNPEVK